MIKDISNSIDLQYPREKIKVSTFILSVYIFISLFNTSSHGAGLGKVIIPIILYILIRFLFEIRKKVKLKLIHFLVILFWMFSLISTGFSRYVKINTDMLTSLIFTLFFIMATSIEYNRKEVKLLVKTLIFTGVLASICIIYNFLIGNKTGWAPRYSLEILGVMKDENYVSAFLMPILALTLYLFFFVYKINKKTKVLLLLNSILISIGCLLTGSRAAFISIILTYMFIFYLILFKSRMSNFKRILLSVLGIVLILIVLIFADKILPEMISKRLFDYTSYKNDIRITELWRTSFTLFYENPILGHGLNVVPIVYGIYSHSVYIDILVGQGLIGLTVYFLILLNLIITRKKVRGLFFVIIFSYSVPLITINGLNTVSIWTYIIFIQILRSYLNCEETTVNDLIK